MVSGVGGGTVGRRVGVARGTRTAVSDGGAALGDAPEHGGVERLLAWARGHCDARLAFAGWGRTGDLVVAAAPGDAGSGRVEATALLRLAWADPELDHAPVLVRTAMLPGGGSLDGAHPLPGTDPPRDADPLPGTDIGTDTGGGVVVAVVPLAAVAAGPAGPEGLLCVVGPAGGSFSPEQLDSLVGVGRRLAAHGRARRAVAAQDGARRVVAVARGPVGASPGSPGPDGAGRR